MPRDFEPLAREFQNRIYTFACYQLGNDVEAQDVTQTVLLKLWKHYEKVEEKHLWHWLIRVTRNACIDAIRRKTTYRKLVPEDLDAEDARQIAAGDPDPLTMTEAHEFQGELEKCLQDLQEPTKSILILREVQGMKYGEISEALDLPLNTVKVYLHRGRRTLREKMKGFMRP